MKYVKIDSLEVGDFAVCFDMMGNPIAGKIERHPWGNARANNHLFSAKFGRWIIPDSLLVLKIQPPEESD